VNSTERFRFFRPADLLIPAVVILIMLLIGRGSGETGGTATVHLPGGGSIALELSVDTTVTVQGHLGGVEVTVEAGKAGITSSPCPGQDCVRSGGIGSPGEVVVCIPSAVFITVEGDRVEGTPDAYSY